MKTYVHTKICIHTFIAALFVIAEKVKTPKQNPCNKKLFNNKKMNDMLLSATTKMDLKKTLLNIIETCILPYVK